MEANGLDDVKAEKAKAIRNYNRLQTVSKLFRLIEFVLAFFLLSWLLLRSPFVIKISDVYFRKLLSVLISPLSIFVISNCIVFTLLAKSGYLSRKTFADDVVDEDYNVTPVPNTVFAPETTFVPEAIMYQDKEVVSEINKVTPLNSDDMANMANFLTSNAKALTRSRSENLERETELGRKASKRLLRRSNTEECQKFGFSGEATVVSELSNTEFQRTIEDFIAKQVKFHKEEKLAIVSL